MNFIFDIGNVLLDFKPEQFLEEIIGNKNDEDALNDIIFKSQEWVMLDLDEITPEESCKRFCKRNPDYSELIKKVMVKIPEMLTPMQKTVQLLEKISASGHKLYFLSNFHKGLSILVQNKHSFFELFYGGVFSCDVNMKKPNKEIYLYLLKKYNLDPKECVFFDDTYENVVAGNKVGINSIHFTNEQVILDFLSSNKLM